MKYVINFLLICTTIFFIQSCTSVQHKNIAEKKQINVDYHLSPELFVVGSTLNTEDWEFLLDSKDCTLGERYLGNKAKIYLSKKRFIVYEKYNTVESWVYFDYDNKGKSVEQWVVNYKDRLISRRSVSTHGRFWDNPLEYDPNYKKGGDEKCDPESLKELIMKKIISYKNEKY